MAKSTIAADTGVLNAEIFYNTLDRLMGASIGVIAVRTREMARGRMLLHQWASMRGMDFAAWDIINGFKTYRALPVSDEDNKQAIAVEANDMEQYLKETGTISGTDHPVSAMGHFATRQENGESAKNNFCGVMLGMVDEWLKEPVVQQHIRDQVARAYQCNDRMILMLTPGTVIPDAIVGDVELIDLSPPSFSEMLDSFTDLEPDMEELGYTPSEDDRALIVQNGLGMTGQEFENAISLGIVDAGASKDDEDHTPIDVHSFVKVVRERKLEILKQTQILELMPDAKMSEIGGLDLLKAELDIQRDAFTAEAAAFGISSPKGFMVVGPPGTGKSLVCKATSHALGIPAIKFDLSGVYNALVGSSEQRMRMCLRMAEDMSPCILFIDEIDKATAGAGGGGGDGGVATRVFGTLLTWMQDKEERGAKVLVIMSANNVENIPPELLRKGRVDDIWMVSFPSSKERAQIFDIHSRKRGHKLTDEELKKLASSSDRFVGAEIEAAVEAALRLDFRAGHKKLMVETLLKKIDEMIPQAKAFPARIEAMKRWCEANARPSSTGASFDAEVTGIKSPIKRRPGTKLAKLKPTIRSNRN